MSTTEIGQLADELGAAERAAKDAAGPDSQLAHRIDQLIGWAKCGKGPYRGQSPDPEEPTQDYYLMRVENTDRLRDDIFAAIKASREATP